MGCRFGFSAIHQNPDRAWSAIRAGVKEIRRIESLISSWKEASETSEINRCAGIRPVKVSRELFELIRRSIHISAITGGAFDITGNISRYYWKCNGQDILPPERHTIEMLRQLIDYRLIELDEQSSTVFLQRKGMSIGFGGIGKGYAAHKAKIAMEEYALSGGMVNASGDIVCWGNPPKNETWSVSIIDPKNHDCIAANISLSYGSVVTSGDYESFQTHEGKKYSHIIDPRTGMPSDGLSSVTVVGLNPEFGDALATALSVLGWERGIRLVNRIRGVECILIDQSNTIHYSDNLKHIYAKK